MKKVAAIVLTVCLVFALAACGGGSTTLEGKGYASAEDAAGAYLEALKKGDAEGIISTFAIETYVEKYDFEASVERMQAYAMSFEMNMPATNEFMKDLNQFHRAGSIAASIKRQYVSIFNPGWDGIDASMLPMESEDDISVLIELLANPEYMKALQTLKVVEFIAPEELSKFYAMEENIKNIQRFTSIQGAEEGTSVAARVEIDGKEYLFCFDAARYGDKWYLVSHGGNIGALLSIPAHAGGVAPYENIVV